MRMTALDSKSYGTLVKNILYNNGNDYGVQNDSMISTVQYGRLSSSDELVYLQSYLFWIIVINPFFKNIFILRTHIYISQSSSNYILRDSIVFLLHVVLMQLTLRFVYVIPLLSYICTNSLCSIPTVFPASLAFTILCQC